MSYASTSRSPYELRSKKIDDNRIWRKHHTCSQTNRSISTEVEEKWIQRTWQPMAHPDTTLWVSSGFRDPAWIDTEIETWDYKGLSYTTLHLRYWQPTKISMELQEVEKGPTLECNTSFVTQMNALALTLLLIKCMSSEITIWLLLH